MNTNIGNQFYNVETNLDDNADIGVVVIKLQLPRFMIEQIAACKHVARAFLNTIVAVSIHYGKAEGANVLRNHADASSIYNNWLKHQAATKVGHDKIVIPDNLKLKKLANGTTSWDNDGVALGLDMSPPNVRGERKTNTSQVVEISDF